VTAFFVEQNEQETRCREYQNVRASRKGSRCRMQINGYYPRRQNAKQSSGQGGTQNKVNVRRKQRNTERATLDSKKNETYAGDKEEKEKRSQPPKGSSRITGLKKKSGSTGRNFQSGCSDSCLGTKERGLAASGKKKRGRQKGRGEDRECRNKHRNGDYERRGQKTRKHTMNIDFET